MQVGAWVGTLGAARKAVHDDLLVELAMRFEGERQPDAR